LDLNDTVPLKSAEVLYGASAGETVAPSDTSKTLTTKPPSVLYATGETEVSFHPSYFTSAYIPTDAPPTDSGTLGHSGRCSKMPMSGKMPMTSISVNLRIVRCLVISLRVASSSDCLHRVL